MLLTIFPTGESLFMHYDELEKYLEDSTEELVLNYEEVFKTAFWAVLELYLDSDDPVALMELGLKGFDTGVRVGTILEYFQPDINPFKIGEQIWNAHCPETYMLWVEKEYPLAKN